MRKSNAKTSLRETYGILIAWVVMCGWTLGWCALNGFQSDQNGPISTVVGMPSWVAYGVALPWFVSTLFTTWYCLVIVQDEEELPSEPSSQMAEKIDQEGSRS